MSRSLMIVRDLHIEGVAPVPPEADPPLSLMRMLYCPTRSVVVAWVPMPPGRCRRANLGRQGWRHGWTSPSIRRGYRGGLPVGDANLVRAHPQVHGGPRAAPADRPVRDPAHAGAFTTAEAIRGAGSVHRQTGMKTARALPGDRNGAGSPLPNSPSQNRPPTSPVNHIRCSADHRPAWGCDAGAHVRRAVGVCMKGTHALRAAHPVNTHLWRFDG